MAKCLWTTLKNNENDGKYRCAGRIQAQGTREFIDNLHTILQIKDKKNDALSAKKRNGFLDKVVYYSYDVKWRVVLEFGTEFGQTFLKIEINEHCTLHMYFL